MRLKVNQFLSLFILLTLAMPVWAHANSTTLHSDGTITIGGTQLKAGDYQLKVEDNANDLLVTHEGKVVAQVPVRWIQLPSKSKASQVEFHNQQVVVVAFAGKTQAVQVQSN